MRHAALAHSCPVTLVRACTGHRLFSKFVRLCCGQATEQVSYSRVDKGSKEGPNSNQALGTHSLEAQKGAAQRLQESKALPEVVPQNVQPAILQPFLEKAADAESKQHYKMAASIYEQVQPSAPL